MNWAESGNGNSVEIVRKRERERALRNNRVEINDRPVRLGADEARLSAPALGLCGACSRRWWRLSSSPGSRGRSSSTAFTLVDRERAGPSRAVQLSVNWPSGKCSSVRRRMCRPTLAVSSGVPPAGVHCVGYSITWSSSFCRKVESNKITRILNTFSINVLKQKVNDIEPF